AALALGVELALARRLHRLRHALRGALEGGLVGRDLLRLLSRGGDVGRRCDRLDGLRSATCSEHEHGKENEEKGGRSSHQYVLSCGCHLVMRTGSQARSGAPSRQVTSVCLRKFLSSRSGWSYGRAWAPRLSFRARPASIMHAASW